MIKSIFLRSLSKRKPGSGEHIGFDRANSVGILSVNGNETELRELTMELEANNKSPRVVSFVTNPEKGKTLPPHSFTAKDISMTGTILSDELLYFTKQKYDFLLCLDSTGNKFIKYLLAKTDAKHRIGFYHENFEGLLDMMIKPGKVDSPISELVRYLKMIRHD